MASQFRINPTLFIGLGSTGYRIVDQIRKRIFEEFGCGGLPNFRYLVLESDAGERRQHPDDFLGKKPEDYEKIKAIDITLDDFQGLQSHLDPKNAKYHAGIAEWLDKAVFLKTDQSFKAGAGNSRQIGRLCLWENFDTVQTEIDNALRDIRAVGNRDKTMRFLKEDYLPRKKGQIEIPKDADLLGNDIHVYLCGTLCGGTCSGIFIDIGYYLMNKLKISGAKKFTGDTGPLVMAFFSIVDHNSVTQASDQIRIINAWSALKELDYYTQPGTSYHAEFNKQYVVDSSGEPYSLVYLAGLTNQAGQEFAGRRPEGLCDMIALNIFLEVATGSASAKEKERVDFKEADNRHFEANFDQPDASWAGYMRSFIGFGLSAICYPRHQIATGISRRIGEIMSEKYLGDERFASGKDTMLQSAKDDCSRLLDECEKNLTVTGQPGDKYARYMKNEIHQILDEGKKEYDDLPPDALKEFIEKFPQKKNEKLRDMLSPPHGSLYSIIINQVDTVGERVLVKAVKESLNAILIEKSVQETIFYMDEILRLLMEQNKKLPKKEPAFSLKVDFSLGVRVHEDFLARLLLLRDKADIEYKQVKWDLFQGSIEDFLKQLVEYHLDQAIIKGLPELKKLQQLTQNIQNAISKLKDRCHKSYEELIKYKPPSNMVIACEDPDDRDGDSQVLTKDVEKGANAILSGPAAKELALIKALEKDSAPLSVFGEKGAEDLLSLIDQHYTKYSIDWVSRFNLGEHVLERDYNKIDLLLKWSFPYIGLNNARFQRLRRKGSTNYIFSHSADLALKLETALKAQQSEISFNKFETPLQHFIICYQEEPALCLSDLDIMEPADRILNEAEMKRVTVGENAKITESTHFTHKKGAIYFDVKRQRMEIETKQKFDGIFHLLKFIAKIFEDAFAKTTSGQKTLRYKKNEMPKTLFIDDKASLQEYINLGNSEDDLWEILRPAMKKIGKDAFLARMEQYTSQIPGQREHEEAERDFERIMGIFFSDK